MSSSVLEAPPRSLDGEQLGRRAVKSSAWVVAGFASTMVLRLVSSVILTRFIHPEVYGVMDLVITLLVALHLFSDIGIVPCIVQSPRGGEPRHLNTVWTLQLLRSVVIFVVAAAIAVPVAKAYNRPILAWLVPAVGLSGVLECLTSTGVFVLNRQVRRGRLVTMEFLSSVVNLIVTILAIYWWNPSGFREVMDGRIPNLPFNESLTWTIVIGSVASKAALVGLSYALTPGGPPKLDWQWDTVREVFGFGRWVFFSTVLNFLAQQTDRLIAPKISDFETNGLYGRALGLSAMATGLVDNIASTVVFPTISRAVERGTDPSQIARRVELIAKLASAVLLSGLFVAGPSIVRVLYPSTYADVGWILQILAVVGWFQCQASVAGALMLGVGKPAGSMYANAAKLGVLLLLLLPAAHLVHRLHLSGIVALIAVVCIGEAVRYICYIAIIARMKLWNPWSELSAAVVVSLVVVVCVQLGGYLTRTVLAGLPQTRLDWVVSMLVNGGVVCAIYGAVAAVFWRRGLLRLPT